MHCNTVYNDCNLLKNKWIIFVKNNYFPLNSALSGLI